MSDDSSKEILEGLCTPISKYYREPNYEAEEESKTRQPAPADPHSMDDILEAGARESRTADLLDHELQKSTNAARDQELDQAEALIRKHGGEPGNYGTWAFHNAASEAIRRMSCSAPYFGQLLKEAAKRAAQRKAAEEAEAKRRHKARWRY